MNKRCLAIIDKLDYIRTRFNVSEDLLAEV